MIEQGSIQVEQDGFQRWQVDLFITMQVGKGIEADGKETYNIVRGRAILVAS